MYRTAGNFWGRKLLQISRFVAIRETFLHKIWGVVPFGTAQARNPRKFSPRKSLICESFFPWKFPTIRYVQGKPGYSRDSFNLYASCGVMIMSVTLGDNGEGGASHMRWVMSDTCSAKLTKGRYTRGNGSTWPLQVRCKGSQSLSCNAWSRDWR